LLFLQEFRIFVQNPCKYFFDVYAENNPKIFAKRFIKPKTRVLNQSKNPLCLLSEQLPWNTLEKEFEKFYRKDFGRPAKPIRLMVSLLILKQMFNESDETVVERWTENPYWQYFSGEEYFQWQLPCDPTELTKFRNRIGEKGVEKILEISIKMNCKSAVEIVPYRINRKFCSDEEHQ